MIKFKPPKFKPPIIPVKKMQQTLSKTAVQDVTNNRVRTSKGLDVNLRPFQKYSLKTIKYKLSNGVTSGTKPNLMDTGTLMRSIMHRKIKDGYEIFLQARNRIGEYHQYGKGNNPKRQWFGLDKNFIKKINTAMGKAFLIKK